MSTVELPSVEVLRVREGDVLVVTAERGLTVDEARDLHRRVAEAFPGFPVVVLDHELRLAVARLEDVP